MRYLSLLIFIITSCTNPPAVPESRADKLAKSICNCTQQLISINSQAEAAPDSISFQKISAELKKARDCVQKLGIKTEEHAALKLSIDKLCSTLAANKEIIPELLGE